LSDIVAPVRGLKRLSAVIGSPSFRSSWVSPGLVKVRRFFTTVSKVGGLSDLGLRSGVLGFGAGVPNTEAMS
jgi:hypothetical protein